jgi:hypothetical protein
MNRVVLILVYCVISSRAIAAVVDLQVTSQDQASVTVLAGTEVEYTISLSLQSDDNEGLASVLFDLEFSGGAVTPAEAPETGDILNFVRPAGLTNPTGFGGTPVDGRLVQIGGAQNIIKNVVSNAPVPTGSVALGVGHTPLVVVHGSVQAPAALGVYELNVTNLLVRIIKAGDNGSGEAWATVAASAGTVSGLTIVVDTLCSKVGECGDIDGDGITDDACQFFECSRDLMSCNSTDRVFADMGGAFGECPADTFANIHDRNHVLSCFAGTNPCEPLNIDAGGPFGDCTPDGFCNIHDANHALAAFAGTTTCTCPPGPIPSTPSALAGNATLTLVATTPIVSPGQEFEVHAIIEEALPSLQSVQLHLLPSGGQKGQLTCQEIRIDARKDAVFGKDAFEATNVADSKMLLGVNTLAGVSASSHGYVATFSYRASRDAQGMFVLDVARPDGAVDGSFLVGAEQSQYVIQKTRPAVVEVRTKPVSSRFNVRRGGVQ